MDSKKLNYILGTLLIISVCFSGFLYGKESKLGIKANATKFTNLEVTGELQTADLTVTDDVAITDDVTIGGDLTITGATLSKMSINKVANTATTTVSSTLTSADAGKTFFVTSVSSTEYYLPASNTASGLNYKFVVGGALTGDLVIKTHAAEKVIEGALIVAGAVVDCEAEHTITFVSDGENVGDYVELYSDGTYWYIGDSGALTGSKLTCTNS